MTKGFGQQIAELSPEVRARLELQLLKNLPQTKKNTIPRKNSSAPCPLSFSQERLFFLYLLDPDSPGYNQPKALRITGDLNPEVMRRVLEAIVGRHEILHSTFFLQDGISFQKSRDNYYVELPIFDLSSWPNEQREAEAHRLLTEITQRPFNLSEDLMLRAALLRLSSTEHILLLMTHHIVSDLSSRDILLREIAALYDAFSANKPYPLPELPIQYGDFAFWQRESLEKTDLQEQLSYWRRQLQGVPAILRLPTDHPRPAALTSRGSNETIVIPQASAQRLRNLSRQQSATLFMTLLAAFKVLLWRYTGQESFLVGVPISGRTLPELQNLLGFFVSSLLLKADFSGAPTFLELLTRVRESALAAYAHPDIPFENLLQESQTERDLSFHPMFQVMFALRSDYIKPIVLSDLTLSWMRMDSEIAKFDLTLTIIERSDDLAGTLTYNSDLFDAATIQRMGAEFNTLIEGIVDDPDQFVGRLPLLTQRERQQLLIEWNDTKREYPNDKCVHELFEEQVEQNPDAVAVVFEDEQLPYDELNRRANQLAHYLQSLGVGPEVLVATVMERSLETVVALLGILKAGGTYVPMDPSYPRERLAFVLQDARVKVVLTQKKFMRVVPAIGSPSSSETGNPLVICLDAERDRIAQETQETPVHGAALDNVAYAVYTSGSTGQPKGVMITHRGICNRLLWGQEFYQLSNADRVLHAFSLSFDFAIWEIFTAFIGGARLIVAQPERQQDSAYLVRLIADHKITVAGFVPSMLEAILADRGIEMCDSLRKVFCGAEVLPSSLQDRFHACSSAELHNTYGPTEASIDVTYWVCKKETEFERTRHSVPIGRPLANTQIYILDPYLQPVPVGVGGELYIGGVGLARGYLNRPDLTAENFIPNAFSDEPGARLYKTGDLGRYLPDGNIEFLGRRDHQAKIRGFRIELGEIEAVLGQHPAVRESVVAAREDAPGEKRLVAYVVADQESTPTINELRSFLKEKLPSHMIPSAFVMLESLPLSPNGKVDRRVLPVPDRARPELAETFVASRTPVEEALASIWSKILVVEQVGIYDNFFELGGHSLLVAKLIAEIQRDLRVDLPVRAVFEFPTIAQLAARIIATQDKGLFLQEETENSYLVNLGPGQNQTPLFCFPYIGGFRTDLLTFARLGRLIGPDYTFYGLQAPGTDGVSEPLRRVEDLAAVYIKAIQTLQPHGPYLLLGECFSGAVAYETAQQLRAQGEEVALLAFLDAKSSAQSLSQYLWRRLSARVRYRIQPILEKKARIGFHLREIQRFERGKRIRYFFDKMDKAIVVISNVLRGGTPLHSQLASTHGGDAERQKSKHMHRAKKAYWLAVSRYRRRPYEGRITLLVNEEWYRSDPNLRRADLAAEGVEVHKITGNHSTYITEYIQVVANELKAVLNRARSGQDSGGMRKPTPVYLGNDYTEPPAGSEARVEDLPE
jgi:amino acid adenylation domain-containing protein